MAYAHGMVAGAGAVALATVASNVWVISSTRRGIHTRAEDLPWREVGLVPGVSRRNPNGLPNPHFTVRMQAAARLYRAERVSTLRVSGGPPECAEMRVALRELGVPDEHVICDGAGLSTARAIRNAADERIPRVTLVVETFHAPRSLFLARHLGLDAIAYAVPTRLRRLPRASMRRPILPTAWRECGARVKAVAIVVSEDAARKQANGHVSRSIPPV